MLLYVDLSCSYRYTVKWPRRVTRRIIVLSLLEVLWLQTFFIWRVQFFVWECDQKNAYICIKARINWLLVFKSKKYSAILKYLGSSLPHFGMLGSYFRRILLVFSTIVFVEQYTNSIYSTLHERVWIFWMKIFLTILSDIDENDFTLSESSNEWEWWLEVKEWLQIQIFCQLQLNTKIAQ